jgi:hypothetical protein
LRYLGIASVAALGVVGCIGDIPEDCVARGRSTTYNGSASYSGQIAPTADADADAATNESSSLGGSSEATVVVDDFHPDCTYERMRFLLHIGECSIWATLAGVRFTGRRADRFVEASAVVEPGQTCAIPLAGGVVWMDVQSGRFELGATYNTKIVVAGEIGAEGARRGHLEWRFEGR